MLYVLLGAIALVALVAGARLLVGANPQSLVRVLRYVVAGGLILVGGVLSIGGRFALGLPALALGFAALFTGRIGPLDFGAGMQSAGRKSTVRSRFIEATLDRDSGRLTGKVVEGTFEGRELDELSDDELRALEEELRDEADSRTLFEAYLDRRNPGWREDREPDAAAGPRGAPDAGAMTDEEAYQILGLAPGAGDAEIRAAHRRLMKGVHPDHGGSSFLAARINEAKDRLLGKHR
ncbi:MAG: DnaJ domain-containing protein [Bauldia sp.]|nr:DnaJ domain-containing protein [Bauldia sp.]